MVMTMPVFDTSDSKESLLQVFASLDIKLGGPVSVFMNIIPYLEQNFDLCTFVVGSVQENAKINENKTSFLGNRFGFFMTRTNKNLKQKIRDSDIILLHGYYLFTTLFVIAKTRSTRIFVMPHGSLELYQHNRRAITKKLFNFAIRIALRKRPLEFLLATESEKVNISLKLPNSKATVVGLGISNQIAQSSLEHRLIGDKINLLCFSRITHKKRIDLCIQALALLNEIEKKFVLTIVGVGDKKLTADLITLARALNVSEQVQFRGFISGSDEVHRVFKSADMFLLPSENENFAIAVAESIGFGVPVVISKYVAMHDFVDKYKTGITISELSPSHLTDAVKQTVDNYSYFRQNCQIFRNNLGWDKVSEKWLDALSRKDSF